MLEQSSPRLHPHELGDPFEIRRANTPSQKRLVIQIPCYNEASSLPLTLSELPRSVPGFDCVEWLVIDDGSHDATAEIAVTMGVDHVIRLPKHLGLAAAFMAGLRAALRSGADVIVNTDADNQYRASHIQHLVRPILSGRADIVVGARPIEQIAHFSPLKKRLQRIGSWVVRRVSAADVADAPSGFRALSRDAALRVNVFNDYTYTLETLIQAGRRGAAIVSVPIETNAPLRPSRLMKSVWSYIWRSIVTVLRIFMIYRPQTFFFFLGLVPIGLGLLLGLRYLVFLFQGTDRAHAPSLILAAITLLGGLSLWIFGLIADLLAVNRRLLEEIQLALRREELDQDAP